MTLINEVYYIKLNKCRKAGLCRHRSHKREEKHRCRNEEIMKRRTKLFSTLMAACMVAGSLTGCGSTAASTTADTDKSELTVVTDDKTATIQNADTAASDDVTEITYWYCWTGPTQENNIELAEMFNETIGKEKGIHVTAEYQGTYDECHQKLQAAYVAGEAPNMCFTF